MYKTFINELPDNIQRLYASARYETTKLCMTGLSRLCMFYPYCNGHFEKSINMVEGVRIPGFNSPPVTSTPVPTGIAIAPARAKRLSSDTFRH